MSESGPEATFVVVGAGISGLSAAWELTSCVPPGSKIVVLEETERVGGLLESATIGGRQVDLGADAFLARRPEAIELCSELGIADELVAPASSHASVWSRGAIRRLPDALVLGVPTRIGPLARSGIVSPLGAARAALDLVMPSRAVPYGAMPSGAVPSGRGGAAAPQPPDRSVGEIVASRLGDQVSKLVTGPLVGGINAGNADELSAEAVFPALIDAARQGGSLMRKLRRANSPVAGGRATESGGATPSGATENTNARTNGEAPVFLTPRAGMASLPEVLAAALRRRGVEILTSQPVESLRTDSGGAWRVETSSQAFDADGLVLAVPAHVASNLLREVDEELAGLLAGVTAASVVLVTFELDPEALIRPLEGNGFLVPAGRGLVTACTYLSSKWPHIEREGEVLIRASTGRSGDVRVMSMPDEEIASEVLGELERMLGHVGRFDAFEGLGGLGALGSPRQVVVTRYPDAFPQYLVGHLGRVSAMEAAAASLPNLALAGASYRGIGVPACIASGRRAARLVAGAPGSPDAPDSEGAPDSASAEDSPGVDRADDAR